MTMPLDPPVDRTERIASRVAIGLVVNSIDDGYQNALLLAVTEAARSRGPNLVCFAGGQLGDASARRRVYALAND